MKKYVPIFLIPFMLVGCDTANDLPIISIDVVSSPVVVDWCPVKDKQSLGPQIEASIFQRMNSEHCGLVHGNVDEKDFTDNSITLYISYDQNEEFIIVDYLINCTSISSSQQPHRHNWYYSAGTHHIKIGYKEILFMTECENEPILYKNGEIYTLEEAYDNGILQDEYIIEHTVSDGGKDRFDFPSKKYFYN